MMIDDGESSKFNMFYRVTHQVRDYILLNVLWEFHLGMEILPDLQVRKQNHQVKVNKM